MNRILLHIPHSSEQLPRKFWQDILLPKEKILQFQKAITDTDTAQLFGKNQYKKIIFKYSRIFCDIEKFDDDREIMNKFGMGVIYTKTNKGERFKKITQDYKNYVLNKFYKPYHEKLDKIAKRSVKKGRTILVDCHSFSKDIIMFDDKKQNLPDICVGYNKNCNNLLVKFVVEYFEKLGYKVGKNYPYSGSLIPNQLSKEQKNDFYSIMIEINKQKYLKSKKDFSRLQKELNALFKQLENISLT